MMLEAEREGRGNVRGWKGVKPGILNYVHYQGVAAMPARSSIWLFNLARVKRQLSQGKCI
jgi:hypothetical protein